MSLLTTPSKHPAASHVLVFGSINMDCTLNVPTAPQAGATITARARRIGLGGKGANQAVAAARAGAHVRLLGAVGDDNNGGWLLDRLRSYGVDASHVQRIGASATGEAIILLEDNGENRIVVVPGANHQINSNYVDSSIDLIANADIVVLQAELPAVINAAIIAHADALGVRVVINLAPYRPSATELSCADPLVVNETEATELLGDINDGIVQNAHRLLQLARSAVITLGAAGAVCVCNDGQIIEIPAPRPSRICDTTGAGDAFVGVLAMALANGDELVAATKVAVLAATRSVEHEGAAEGYPDFAQLF